LIVGIDASRARVDPADRLAFNQRLLEVLSTVPDVERAAISTRTPLDRSSQSPVLAQAEHVSNAVTPGWFTTYGTRLLAGRDIGPNDTAGAAPIAVVNEALARKFFPDRSPLGEIFEKRTIVGVVGNTVFASVRGGVKPTMYVPRAQSTGEGPPDAVTALTVSLRAAQGSPTSLTQSVANALSAFDPHLTFTFRPLEDFVAVSVSRERLTAMLSGLFGLLALLLSGLGLYGVTSYAVSRRRVEIGIRVALGAQRAHVLKLVLWRSLVVTATGTVLGLLGAVTTTGFLEAMLFGVTPLDPLTLSAVSMALVLVATTAALLPARRAAKIDPILALRAE
jgi:predicted permease